ncbi:MAG: transposase [Chloroflexi bacterium]|nr:transposase [Chloroflexota bacterium]
MSRYRFIAEERRVYPLRRLCAVLKVSVSGFYDWLKRTPSRRAQANHGLSARIRAVHEASRQTYGTLRVQAELRAHGERAGKHRIARLMRQMGLQTKGRRRFQDDYPARCDPPPRSEPAGRRLHGQAVERKVAVGYHLHRDPRGMAVSGRHSRCVFAAHCGVGDE